MWKRSRQLEIAGEASTGKETLQRILDLEPDVVLLDQQMPELDGLAVVRSLRGARTPLIIFVTAYEATRWTPSKSARSITCSNRCAANGWKKPSRKPAGS